MLMPPPENFTSFTMSSFDYVALPNIMVFGGSWQDLHNNIGNYAAVITLNDQ